MKNTLKDTAKQLALIALCATVAAICGCLAIEVEDYGDEAVRDSAGNPVCDTNGVVQTVRKGQRWHYNKNMVEQSAEEVDFTRKPGDDIHFTAKNYRDIISAELNKVVDTSFKGASELAAKIGAAIATSGGSVAGEAGSAAIKTAITNYLAKGGSAEKATVECKGGSCTISDGSVTEVCENCVEK